MSFKTLKLSAAAAVLAMTCANAALADVPSWCGPKKATIALLDGYGGNSWRQVTTASGKQTASLCPSITSYEYADGNGDTQKSISDIKVWLQRVLMRLWCLAMPDLQCFRQSLQFLKLVK
jgi:ribose transport system substrate-binding protein